MIQTILITLIIGFCSMFEGKTQVKKFAYTINRNGSKIGTISVNEIKDGDKIIYKLQSELKTGFILKFKGMSKEEAVYQKGILLYSYVYQKLNSTEKINKETKLENTGYMVIKNGAKEKLEALPIKYNMICLFTNEPLNTTEIFSDKYQKNLAIKRTGLNQYRICFPDGNYNDYYYQNGICSKINVNTTFYNVVIQLSL